MSTERPVARRRTPPRPLNVGVYGARAIPSTYSGYETFLTTLLPELVRRGMDVTMYCRPGEGADGSDWNGVHRRVVPALGGKNSSTLSHGLVAGLAARRARHDVLLVVNVANAAFCLIGRATGQPVVLNVDGQEWLRDKWGPAARRVFRYSAAIAHRCANALIADCEAMADVYREEFQADSTVIPYCVTDIDWIAEASAVERHGVTAGKYLMIAGRHNPENNLHRVAELLAASDLDCPLLVLGKANYDSPVTRRIAELAERDDRIRPIGHVGDREEFFNLIHHAAVYLHGHSVGGTNPSLIEAMASRARICALDNVFNRETLGVAGTFFRLDPPDLIETLRAMLDAPEEDGELARGRAYHRATGDFSVKAICDAYELLLVEAAKLGRRTVSVPTVWADA